MTDKPYPGGVHLDFRNNKIVKTSGTGGGTHTILGEPERTTTNFPNSTELINLAHREWKNRQERKGHDDEVAWTSGWISGYLTGKGSLSDELKKERERVLDELIEEYDKLAMEGWNAWKLEGWNAWKFKEIMKSLREHL